MKRIAYGHTSIFGGAVRNREKIWRGKEVPAQEESIFVTTTPLPYTAVAAATRVRIGSTPVDFRPW